MFRNPVFDLLVTIPALLITALVGMFIMLTPAHAAEMDTSSLTSSTSWMLPDPDDGVITIDRKTFTATTSVALSPRGLRVPHDLAVYAASVMTKDPYIAAIELSGKAVTVTYHRHGRLFGLVPISLPRTATIYSNGNVSFTEPWYGAVTVAEKDRLRTALEVRAHALLTGEGYLSSMSLGIGTQAELLDLIRELVG